MHSFPASVIHCLAILNNEFYTFKSVPTYYTFKYDVNCPR